MEIEPIDADSDLSLIYTKNQHAYCKRHGAMNCNHVDGNRFFYRCYSTYKIHPDDKQLPAAQRRYIDRACNAACILVK